MTVNTILPGFARDPDGKPLIGLDPQALFAYGDLIRRCEQLILDQFSRGLVSGTTHTCIGQELAAMAVVRALDHPDDGVLSNHRNHGHFMTYSGDFIGLVAEIMGRQGGVCGGRGGSQHLAYRHFHSNGVQGGMLGIGVGLALARKRRREAGNEATGAMVAAMIGDGTLGQGMVYEAMNLASIWQAPLLFVVEHNRIAQTTLTVDTIGGGDIEARGRAFGLPTWRFDDADPDLFARVDALIGELRRAGGPGLLVLDTRRLGPHSKGDDLRDSAEMDEIRARDPLQALGRRLDAAARDAIAERNAAFIEAVREAAGASPEAAYQQVPEHIFAAPPGPGLDAPLPALAAGANVRQALNQALRYLLDHEPAVLLLGEDMHDPYGGAFKVTEGLSAAYPGRVVSTPISEAGITGTAIGLATEGLRPVLEVMFADFLSLCIDQLYNHAVKFPGVFEDTPVPLVIRSPSGGRRGYGPTHSQSPENLLTSIPGLTVVFPSHRHAVGQLLVDATLRWPYPTLFLEHKLLYGETQTADAYHVLPASPDDPGAALFPSLMRRCEEPDLCIVSYGGMLPVVERAAAQLEQQEELAIDILVPALLAPLPRHSLVPLLLDYPRIAVAEESHHDYGVSAEILASLLEAGYQGQVVRIGTPPVPIASARSLERQILPDEQRLVDDIIDLF